MVSLWPLSTHNHTSMPLRWILRHPKPSSAHLSTTLSYEPSSLLVAGSALLYAPQPFRKTSLGYSALLPRPVVLYPPHHSEFHGEGKDGGEGRREGRTTRPGESTPVWLLPTTQPPIGRSGRLRWNRHLGIEWAVHLGVVGRRTERMVIEAAYASCCCSYPLHSNPVWVPSQAVPNEPAKVAMLPIQCEFGLQSTTPSIELVKPNSAGTVGLITCSTWWMIAMIGTRGVAEAFEKGDIW